MYVYKPTTLKSKEPSPRAIVGWEPRAPVAEPHEATEPPVSTEPPESTEPTEPEPPRKRRKRRKSCPVHKKRWE
eukprot:1344524-Prymnesium_polylepis.1